MANEEVQEKKEKTEPTEEELHHRNQVMIAIGATSVLLLAIGLQIFKYNIESEKMKTERVTTRQLAKQEAAQNAFWLKEEIKGYKAERDLLLKKIESESRMIQWGLERSRDSTVVEQAKDRRKKHQKKLEEVKKKLAELREMQ